MHFNITRRAGMIAAVFQLAACMSLAAWPTRTAAPRGPAATVQPEAMARRPWMNRALSPGRRAELLLKAMTLDEKIALLHGVQPMPVKGYVGYVPGNARLGIPALRLADGRAGVGNGAHNATLLPAPLAVASSWNPNLLHAYGQVLGQEEWAKGTNVFLGPTVDVVRVPEWGRSFETYGEDPYLNGRMAAAEIRGVQSAGPIADANMYLTMQQETNRFQANSVVDERTLEEIYLPPFRAAVQAAHVGTLMCAYVKTNGIYSCQNRQLLHTMLRRQLGFHGWVMSDWGATHSTAPSARAGLDQEMPGSRYYGAALKRAVQNGAVTQAELDAQVRRILRIMFRQGLFDRKPRGSWTAKADSPADASFARRAAEAGMVLLKNKGGALPLPRQGAIAVIGEDAGGKTVAEGGGSSYVVPPYVISPLAGIRKRAGASRKVIYDDGANLAAAAHSARAARVAIVFAGAPESEGADRPNLQLPGNQDALIAAVAAANPNTIVVLNTGGPVLMPWLSRARAVLEAWYPGQESGNAIAAVLFGDADPGGKLTLTFPAAAKAVPTAGRQQWPGINGNSVYSEKLETGYRWYEAQHQHPLFPFGFGLSYTTFKLSHFRLHQLPGQGQVEARVEVTNTGMRAGSEVVQAYCRQPAANGEPGPQLCGFAEVQLRPGQARALRLPIEQRGFMVYDTARHAWRMPRGRYEVAVGTSSENLPMHAAVEIP